MPFLFQVRSLSVLFLLKCLLRYTLPLVAAHMGLLSEAAAVAKVCCEEHLGLWVLAEILARHPLRGYVAPPAAGSHSKVVSSILP